MTCPLTDARGEPVWRGDQGTPRTQVDDVAGHLEINALLDIRANLHLLAPPDHSELLIARDLLRKADAARAVNAACHVRRDQRPRVFVLDCALPPVEAGYVRAEATREPLQLTLAPLA